MRRRAPNEHIEPYRRRLHSPKGNELRKRLAIWAKQFGLHGNYPDMPKGVEDRDADVWEALIAVADAVGGKWPARARVAAVALVALAKESTPSLGIRLLSDIRQIFGDADQLATETVLQRLNELDEAPWGNLRGKPLDARRLANYMRRYGIKSKTVRLSTATPKGYAREDLFDAWERYLEVAPNGCATSATGATDPVVVDEESACPRCDGEGCP